MMTMMVLPFSAFEDLVVSTGGDGNGDGDGDEDGDGDGDGGALPLDGKGQDDHVVHPAPADVEDNLASRSCLLQPSSFTAAVMMVVMS
jgi:hypothetical protein